MIAMLGLVGCGDLTTVAIGLSNGSGQPLSDISANFAGNLKRVANITPGQFVSLVSHSGGEGMVCLTFRQGGTMQNYAIGYMTENMPTHYRITVHDGYVVTTDSGLFKHLTREARVHRPRPSGKECRP